MSRGTAVANAIVADLNDAARSWFGTFTAARRWKWQINPKDLSGLRCSVIVADEKRQAASRAKNEYDFTVDVFLQKKLTFENGEVVLSSGDEIADLADAIADRFDRLDLSNVVAGLTFLEPEIAVIQKQIDDNGVMAVVVRTHSSRVA